MTYLFIFLQHCQPVTEDPCTDLKAIRGIK